MTPVNSNSEDAAEKARSSEIVGALGVSGVKFIELPHFVDFRGSLSFAEFPGLLPFPPRRFFLTYNVPSHEVRGEHAHRQCHQLLVCVAGHCSVIFDDGERRGETLLDRPNLGIYIPPMVWSVEYKHSANSVLLVLASDTYQPEDYIRNYDRFLSELKPAAR